MFGIKWPVLWMAFMMVSAKDLGKGKGPEYPDGIVATFTARENGQLESLVALWQQELRSSISKLQETREVRIPGKQALVELSDGQNPNSVVLIGPDEEASEWEVN
jgi:hypothetical protein